ncbi:MAG: glycosyltransferase family 2 protein [Daejeonella sp.]|uniref:glycosyltransferase family 2 protein n=1 Tax=Daejeonella sp. TaxID=2805397 RepID=UPI003C793A7C
MNNLPSVSIVVLNWNGQSFLEQFLPSICASTYPNLQVIIGDNASTDNSVSFVRSHYSKVRIILNDKNYGFAGGYNKVLDQVESDYYILLNSDVEVEPGWIEPVIELMESDSKIAAAQPKVRSYRAKHMFEYAGAAGGFMDFLGYPLCRGRIFDTVEADTGQYDDVKEIFWASGAALFIRRSRWEEVGGLDEDFFAHMEEIDLCWRLKNIGLKVMYCPNSVVYHVGGGTLSSENPFKTYLNFRNNLILIQKNLPFFHSALVIFCRLWLDLIALIKFLYDGKTKDAWAVNKAHVSFFKDLFKNARKASKIPTAGFNSTGIIKTSIVWHYFALKKKTFKSL